MSAELKQINCHHHHVIGSSASGTPTVNDTLATYTIKYTCTTSKLNQYYAADLRTNSLKSNENDMSKGNFRVRRAPFFSVLVLYPSPLF